jgi:hypothetical protein
VPRALLSSGNTALVEIPPGFLPLDGELPPIICRCRDSEAETISMRRMIGVTAVVACSLLAATGCTTTQKSIGGAVVGGVGGAVVGDAVAGTGGAIIGGVGGAVVGSAVGRNL